jgi:hypothetical protein
MRKGKNPSKNIKLQLRKSNHRIIIPLYIPNEEGYYKDAWSIFVLCIESLHKTSRNNLLVSVCSNGCSDMVNEKLFSLYKQGLITELFIEKENIGKINSILKALRTAEERFITITDADILFLNHWEQQVMSVFENFPKAAAVSPMPVFRTQSHYTANVFWDYFFSKKLHFSRVKNPEALTLFAKSIGWPWLDTKWKDVILTIENNKGIKAVVGCNHSVVTYKREIFESLPKTNSAFVLGGNSEGDYLDKLSSFYDGYRFATYDNYAYHMGNTKEIWMDKTVQELVQELKLDFKIKTTKLKKSSIRYFVKWICFKKIMSFELIKARFYLAKGLTKEQLKNFIN